MSTPKLRDQHRTGLVSGCTFVLRRVHEHVRATVPAIGVLLATPGVKVEIELPGGSSAPVGWATPLPDAGGLYRITITSHLPPDVRAVYVGGLVALRLACEEKYPGELADYALALEWTPCPTCGAPLVPAEAGRVPWYRVCSRSPFHHWLG